MRRRDASSLKIQNIFHSTTDTKHKSFTLIKHEKNKILLPNYKDSQTISIVNQGNLSWFNAATQNFQPNYPKDGFEPRNFFEQVTIGSGIADKNSRPRTLDNLGLKSPKITPGPDLGSPKGYVN
jgi:hypothetical protein